MAAALGSAEWSPRPPRQSRALLPKLRAAQRKPSSVDANVVPRRLCLAAWLSRLVCCSDWHWKDAPPAVLYGLPCQGQHAGTAPSLAAATTLRYSSPAVLCWGGLRPYWSALLCSLLSHSVSAWCIKTVRNSHLCYYCQSVCWVRTFVLIWAK